MKKRFSEEQIVKMIQEHKEGKSVTEISREYVVAEQTFKARALDKEDETKADESKEWWTYEWDLHNRLSRKGRAA